MIDTAQALAALSALAHADRLALVRLLVPAGAGGLAAGEIARALGLSASRLSFHLAQMQAAGLLFARPQGRRVIYAVDMGRLGSTIAFLLNDCCLDHPEVVACCRTAPAPHRAGPGTATVSPAHSTSGMTKT